MDGKLRTIEVDAATAKVLETRAAERGVSVAELVADLAASDAHARPEERETLRPADEGELAELDRRWAAVQAGASTVSHEEVVGCSKLGERPPSSRGLNDEGRMVGGRARRSRSLRNLPAQGPSGAVGRRGTGNRGEGANPVRAPLRWTSDLGPDA
jgi:hypothetical protein